MKRVLCLALALCMLLTAVAFADQEAEKQLEKEIGAFEITAEQRELAKSNTAGYPVLDAGRGNPNWINAQARYAFTRLMNYAISECELTMNEGGMAGQAKKEGIGERFDAAMDPEDPTDAFLIAAVDLCVNTLGLSKDSLLKELVDAVIGDYYPTPSRCLPNTEAILNAFLQATLYDGEDLAGHTGIFPTEGGSAAMVYIFEALSHNRLLKPGDQIAIATPIFTPYMQIPSVKDYGLVSIDVSSTAEDNWDIAEEEIAKLEDPSVKAFFLVNPSNPASHALSKNTLKRLSQVVEKNPDLIILTDDVYGTFAKDFQSAYAALPFNTILVYSFSKLYGVTEYAIVTADPDSMPFLDRVVADSRSIGLYHTSGLSTPSQVFMDLLALSHLIYAVRGEEDPYIRLANDTVHARYTALMDALGLEKDEGEANAQYYTLVDIYALVAAEYGEELLQWMQTEKTEIDFLNDLAGRKGVVLMYGPGFSAPAGTVRISLANLNAEDYQEIARRLFELLDEYCEEAGIGLENAA